MANRYHIGQSSSIQYIKILRREKAVQFAHLEAPAFTKFVLMVPLTPSDPKQKAKLCFCKVHYPRHYLSSTRQGLAQCRLLINIH